MDAIVSLGSISTGTLRTEDLLAAFADELERIIRAAAANCGIREPETLDQFQLVRDARALLEKGSDDWTGGEHQAATRLVREGLKDALNEYAPPYCYFGPRPGDGGDFGFWLDEDALRAAIHDGDVLEVVDQRDAERRVVPEFLYRVNARGNATLYDLHLDEIWSLVQPKSRGRDRSGSRDGNSSDASTV
jgi:hypothetical protein